MKRILPVPFALALLVPAAPGKEATPLLKDREAKTLSELFSDYFRSKFEEDYKNMVKTYEKLTKQLDSTAKAKKVESLLVSPIDLRAVLGAPIFPEKSPKKGFLVDRSTEVALPAGQTMKVDYLLQLPRDYREDTATPCILVLPPPQDRMDQLKNWLQKAYPDAVTDRAMLIVPVKEEGSIDWMSDEGRQRAYFAVTDAYKHFHVDRRRLFLEGHGVTGAPAIAFGTTYPTLFSGLVLRGLDQAPDTSFLGNAAHLPMLLLSTGEADAKKLVAEFAEEAKAKGVTAEVQDAQVAADGSADEAAYTKVGDFVTGTWKNVAPKRVSVVVPTPIQSNAYWISLPYDQEYDPEKPVKLDAEVFSETNEIHVKTTPDVTGFTIYLNDELVDMGKPIKVFHRVMKEEGEGEAKVVFEGTKARNIEFALENWFLNRSGNLGEVYTNAIDVEVPQ